MSISQSKYMSVEKDKRLWYNTHKESCEVQREEEVMSKLWLWNDAFKICNEAMQGYDKSLGFEQQC